MQKRFGFRPLGPADGPVKTAIFSGNSSRLYDYKAPARWSKMDRFAALREEYFAVGSTSDESALWLRGGLRPAMSKPVREKE
jgi:hypothetical protein